MIYISHRGNLDGKSEKDENNPEYVMNAVKKSFDVEIDVWFKEGNFFLGHDDPKFTIERHFLEKKQFWCHAKNTEALYELSKMNCHYFWHQEDDYTITSKGIIWAYPGKKLTSNSICVLPELFYKNIYHCLGICSDYIQKYKK